MPLQLYSRSKSKIVFENIEGALWVNLSNLHQFAQQGFEIGQMVQHSADSMDDTALEQSMSNKTQ